MFKRIVSIILLNHFTIIASKGCSLVLFDISEIMFVVILIDLVHFWKCVLLVNFVLDTFLPHFYVIRLFQLSFI